LNAFKKTTALFTTLALSVSLLSPAFADSDQNAVAPSSLNVPNPTVTGPIPSDSPGDVSRNYPFGATDLDLGSIGYVEEEFFIEGEARQYTTPALETSELLENSETPYKTRIVVRRPANQEDFNGKVILEWYNVTAGLDLEFDWLLTNEYITRSGYAWVGVSAQRVGVNALKGWSGRYSSLDVTAEGTLNSDQLSYDIYSQVAQSLRSPNGNHPLGELEVDKIIASGHSQSARYLATYYNSIHSLHQIIDGFVIRGISTPLRKELDTKMMRTMAEGDVRQFASSATVAGGDENDAENFRRWEVAGTSHVDWQQRQAYESTLMRDLGGISPVNSTKPPFSRIPFHYVQGAAYEYMSNWIEGGEAPPIAPRLAWVDNDTKSRDAYGNALGGIRLPQHEVPTATNTGDNTGPGFERLYGSHEPFDSATLKKLYRNNGAYVSKINQATNAILNQGFILNEDAQKIRKEAAQSSVGKK
jgi:hypothetical protein